MKYRPRKRTVSVRRRRPRNIKVVGVLKTQPDIRRLVLAALEAVKETEDQRS